jgi:hypothetical protein
MQIATRFIFVVAALAILAGCEAPKRPGYHWGDYEALLYNASDESDNIRPDRQARKLEALIEDADRRGRRVPPGVHAHLAYMYLLIERPDLARDNFLLEKEKYPETAVFIDHMVERMSKP